MKLDQYGKFSGSVLLYNAGRKNKPLASETFDDPENLIKHVSDAIGHSLRKSDISKILISVKIHSAKYMIEFIPELYMTGWEKANYAMCLPSKLLDKTREYLASWRDFKYSSARLGSTEIEKIGIAYEY
jgi:hypothetical protein